MKTTREYLQYLLAHPNRGGRSFVDERELAAQNSNAETKEERDAIKRLRSALAPKSLNFINVQGILNEFKP